MIELSAASTSSTFPSINLVSSSTSARSICSATTNTSTNLNGMISSRLPKFNCQDIEKLKQKYRIQHTCCLTHLQTLIHKNRIPKCRDCSIDEQCRVCLECSSCFCRHHAQQHARLSSHPLVMDIKRLFIYCYNCGDVQYDQLFERARRKILSLRLNPTTNPSSSSPIQGICGLLNLGNTCFMNSVLQAFVHAPVLRDCFLSEREQCDSNNPNHSVNNCIMCQLRRLYHHVHGDHTNNEPFIPSQLLYLIWTHENHLAGFAEQDAQELLMALFNIIHSQNSIDESNDEKSCSCIIDRFFKGALQSEITCSQCGSVSTKNDLVRDISLQLPSTTNDETLPLPPFSLENCLWRFTHSETLSNFYCDKCQLSMSANIKLTISQAPIVACFHLKRFQYVKKSRSKMRKKISAHVSFPDQLNLSSYMTKHECNDQTYKYSLFAVISHFGSSVETGHYLCYVKLQFHNRWFRCDDHSACEVTAEEVFRSECYLLFYQRLNEDSTY